MDLNPGSATYSVILEKVCKLSGILSFCVFGFITM